MKKASFIAAGALATLAVPLVSFAQTLNNINDVGTWIINLINNVLVPVLFSVAFIVFLWGAFTTFIAGAHSEEVKEKGKNLMIWGLIGFFVMVSIWGLVNLLTGTISFGNNSGVDTPTTGIQVGG